MTEDYCIEIGIDIIKTKEYLIVLKVITMISLYCTFSCLHYSFFNFSKLNEMFDKLLLLFSRNQLC